MSKIKNILTQKEKIYWEGTPNAGRYFIKVVCFIIISTVFLILGIYLSLYYREFIGAMTFLYIIGVLLFIGVVYQILLYKHLEYAITNTRVIIQGGVIGRDYKSVDFDKIQDTIINVGLLDKIFGTGSIEIKTAGVNVVQSRYGSQVVPTQNVIGHINNPYEVAKVLKEKASVKQQKEV